MFLYFWLAENNHINGSNVGTLVELCWKKDIYCIENILSKKKKKLIKKMKKKK